MWFHFIYLATDALVEQKHWQLLDDIGGRGGGYKTYAYSYAYKKFFITSEITLLSTFVIQHIEPIITLGGDKVSMLTHTYPHKPLRKIKVIICNHQADSPFYVWSDVWFGDLQV